MNAARLNLGLFGIIDRITLRAVPAFNVRNIDRTDLTMTDGAPEPRGHRHQP